MNSLMVSASLNSTSVTAATASRFLKPLAMECGAEATVGYPMARDREATLATPSMNLARRSSGLMSRMAGAKMVPESYTCNGFLVMKIVVYIEIYLLGQLLVLQKSQVDFLVCCDSEMFASGFT